MKRELAMNFIIKVCSLDGVKQKHLIIEVKIKMLDFNEKKNVSTRAVLLNKFKTT